MYLLSRLLSPKPLATICAQKVIELFMDRPVATRSLNPNFPWSYSSAFTAEETGSPDAGIGRHGVVTLTSRNIIKSLTIY